MIQMFKNKQSGQGLLETVFAIGVLLMAAAAILTVAIASLAGQRESESSVIANNLAKEGLEVVRHIRDSNWLAGDTWNANIPLGTAIAFRDNATGGWGLLSEYETTKLFIDENNITAHRPTPKPSVYSRELTIKAICQSDSGEIVRNQCGQNEKYIGIEVASKVSWPEKGRDRSLVLYEILYDWK